MCFMCMSVHYATQVRNGQRLKKQQLQVILASRRGRLNELIVSDRLEHHNELLY